MSSDVSPDAKHVMETEERAHRVRMDILGRPGLLERLRAGRAAIERGEGMTLEEFERELAKPD